MAPGYRAQRCAADRAPAVPAPGAGLEWEVPQGGSAAGTDGPPLHEHEDEGDSVPTGKVKWFDAKKGFGFLAADDGQEVFLPSSALPSGATTVKPGTRMEFGVAQGRRGAQALSVRILDRTPSVAKNVRKPADEMVEIVEDTIKLLDGVSMQLRKGRYPDAAGSTKLAAALRAIADNFDGS